MKLRKGEMKMKKVLQICICIIFAWCCLSLIGGFSDSQVQRHTITHIVQEGETMYGIADNFFLLKKKRFFFDEFWYNVSKDKNPLPPNRRYLQPGDVVTVNYYTVKNQ